MRPRDAGRVARSVSTGLLAGLVLLSSGQPGAVAGPGGASSPRVAAPGSAPVPSPTPVPAASVQDEDPTSTEGVRIVLDEVDPAVARAGEPLELRGRVVNDGQRRRRLTSLTVAATWEPLGTRQAVTDWVEATDPGLVAGRVLGDDAIGPVVAPGRELPFSVRVPAEALAGRVADRGVLGLRLTAEDAETRTDPTAADAVSLRTVLTVEASQEPPAVPLSLAWVVPLTLPADPALVSPDPQVRNPAWYSAVGPASTPRTWLDGLDLPGVTWMVDPALLRTLSPADSLTGPGETVPEGRRRNRTAGRRTGGRRTTR
ncbi:hypothetical protein [Ornithinimicrobium sp. W1665]|uniref:hypothetical protein n=1 Tax=Ornithinimicrobium sp. W1665 TaxID=3416666 RepID=UPI003D6B8DCA